MEGVIRMRLRAMIIANKRREAGAALLLPGYPQNNNANQQISVGTAEFTFSARPGRHFIK